MPAPGDQHRITSVTTNPFEEAQPRVSEYTAQEIATLQSRLNKQLGPEYISGRDGPGGKKVHYIAAEKCIQLANEVFGFNGWSSSIRDVQVDYVEEIPHLGKFNMGISVIMRVVLRDGTFHEDIGYGHIENCKGKAAGFEKTKKEATTDALKRALRHFGNVLGNCIYDRDYVSKVTKIRVAPTKIDINSLHRHSDHAPVKKEPEPEEGSRTSGDATTDPDEAEDEFGAADFDDADFGVANTEHPDEVMVDAQTSALPSARTSPIKAAPNSALQRSSSITSNSNAPPSRTLAKATSLGAASTNALLNAPALVPTTRAQAPPQRQPPAVSNGAQRQPIQPANPPLNFQPPTRPPLPTNAQQARSIQPQTAPGTVSHPNQATTSLTVSPYVPSHIPPYNQMDPAVPANPPIGFFTARVAETVKAAPANLPKNVTFDPHAESPSIPKTVGIDHSRSKAVQINRDATGNVTGIAEVPPEQGMNTGNRQPQHQLPHPIPAQPMQAQLHAPGGVGISAAPAAQRPNFVNPHLDASRRIGMPGAPGMSPLQNRSSYRVPTLKRPADGPPPPVSATNALTAQPRPALADVTGPTMNVQPPPPAGGMPADKKQRVAGPGGGQARPAVGDGGGNVVAT